jgi:hypothetical protein
LWERGIERLGTLFEHSIVNRCRPSQIGENEPLSVEISSSATWNL